MTYVFDIDGTICHTEDSNYLESKPYYDRIEKINQLYDQGHIILYHTARGMGRYANNRSLAESDFWLFTNKQLQEWGAKYHNLFLGKPAGDVYIDDKGMRDENFFTN